MLRSTVSKVMWVGKATVFLLGVAVILALVLGVASTALGDNGDPFLLGEKNVAAAVSTLTKEGVGPALSLKVGANQPPLQANAAAGTATGLSADELDGLDSADFQGKYAQTVVAKSGGDFTSVQAALNSITDASGSKHYLVWVGPGTYNGRVQMKRFVDIEGAGELATRITASGGGGFGAGSSVVSGASDAELRHLTVENTGGGTYAMAIFNGSASPRISNVTATGEGADRNRGVVNADSSPRMTDVTATASGGSSAFGVDNSGGSSPTMTDVTATASGGNNACGMENSTSSPKMTNVSVTASGGSTENTGMYSYLHSSPTIRESVISASGTNSRGVWSFFPDDTTSLVTIENSEVKGATGTIRAEDGYKVNVGASKLDGGTVSTVGTGSEVKCAGVHDENYTFSQGPTCP
jgi:hypothetical protein